ncbi:MAG: hypothetical protein UU65_C0002G0213 [candidate division CPR2 bacterium GW2011_GWC1_41_48]|uniref:Uncharacterized protein n=1 Tax=candidate division CPR2 bacterium GW2011_GWC1_41_48 TaxID=1618344 RepID=A0A0G0W8X6_UNCC2|nr:MAG: hypothetical protein UT47_C0002G0091 [candidate division CPR2 bacterium GW2011_GWC2_39_35]KKR27976.1 MAG: hypothetical protein UT60_C0031G0027 [candidate division CPR2 bacterium GW2011_GWD2_39_7]KKR29577.1 MAG: hypothetical protein UT59_C0004G0003 [candidate division CPR2 bacterium GW2011_GWD1_39_7]KKS09435.1 MAG: hypothetical protein UU65_C0002G0213 [candidate division CPR2 bacterium GW2011_GWC1_41_48]OGB55902.1 MAG: hypothetical protein A2Y27_00650 [candidate division CPR2 bacterium G
MAVVNVQIEEVKWMLSEAVNQVLKAKEQKDIVALQETSEALMDIIQENDISRRQGIKMLIHHAVGFFDETGAPLGYNGRMPEGMTQRIVNQRITVFVKVLDKVQIITI